MTAVATLLRDEAQIICYCGPESFSAPTACSGIVNFPLADKTLLSIASCAKAANRLNADCIALGRA
jgi:hypothetical protein